MKNFLLLPLLLLASCAPMAASRSPLAVGDQFLLSGTTRDGQAVSQTVTLRDAGKRDEDGDWSYRADGTTSSSARVTIDTEQDFLVVLEGAELETSLTEGKILGCFAQPSGPGWRSADGFLLRQTLPELIALAGQVEGKSNLTALQALIKAAGECRVTRK